MNSNLIVIQCLLIGCVYSFRHIEHVRWKSSKLTLQENEEIEPRSMTSSDTVQHNSKYLGIRPSLFPNVPPYCQFVLYNESIVPPWPREVQKYLKFRKFTINSRIIRATLRSSGFQLVDNSRWNFPWRELATTPPLPHQKINQHPGATHLNNKAKLWKNLKRSIEIYGSEIYNFVPQTFALPIEKQLLRKTWDEKNCNVESCLWIVKPTLMANGWGIRMATNWNEIENTKGKIMVAQEYIQPYLVNDRKFDLRLYVFVTSFRPLRAYLFKNGFVRFAATKYTADPTKFHEPTIHLTNRAINQPSKNYVKNDNLHETKGSQWSVQALWKYFDKREIDTASIITKIDDLIIKTLVAVESSVMENAAQVSNRYNTYQIYGFDIGIDEKLKPWLFEVNVAPGMQTDSGFLRELKGKLVTEYLNIASYHFPPSMSKTAQKILKKRLGQNSMNNTTVVFNPQLYQRKKSIKAIRKHEQFTASTITKQEYVEEILTNLTSDDLRQLITAEDELTQCDEFKRIFPSPTSHLYLKYFGETSYYNLLLDAWEHKYSQNRTSGINRLIDASQKKLHLKK